MLTMKKRKPQKTPLIDLPRKTVAEIAHRFEKELSHQSRVRSVTYFNGALTGGAFINTIVLHFLAMDETAKNEAVDVYIREYEKVMALEESGPSQEVPIQTMDGVHATGGETSIGKLKKPRSRKLKDG